MLQGEPAAILPSFIKLQLVIKIFVLSIFEWPLKTDFTVLRDTINIYFKCYLRDMSVEVCHLSTQHSSKFTQYLFVPRIIFQRHLRLDLEK